MLVDVVVVDDSSAYREAAAQVISAADGFQLAGAACDTAEARRIVTNLAADPGERAVLVLMDLNLGPENGIEATAELLRVHPSLRVALVSTVDPEDLPASARACGAIAFLHKSRLDPATLRDLHGGTYDWIL